MFRGFGLKGFKGLGYAGLFGLGFRKYLQLQRV